MGPRDEEKNTNEVGIDIAGLIMKVEQRFEGFPIGIGYSSIVSQEIFVIVLPMLNLVDGTK